MFGRFRSRPRIERKHTQASFAEKLNRHSAASACAYYDRVVYFRRHGKVLPTLRCSVLLAAHLAWFLKVRVFWIVGMSAARHLGPHHSQTRITQTFQSNFRGVITNNRVIPHQLKKLAALFRSGLEFGFVGKFL